MDYKGAYPYLVPGDTVGTDIPVQSERLAASLNLPAPLFHYTPNNAGTLPASATTWQNVPNLIRSDHNAVIPAGAPAGARIFTEVRFKVDVVGGTDDTHYIEFYPAVRTNAASYAEPAAPSPNIYQRRRTTRSPLWVTYEWSWRFELVGLTSIRMKYRTNAAVFQIGYHSMEILPQRLIVI